MPLFLGIDTSNYTTSVALYDSDNHKDYSARKLLPVKAGEKGIRQSDAVFHHTQQLPDLVEEIKKYIDKSLWPNWINSRSPGRNAASTGAQRPSSRKLLVLRPLRA